VTARTVAEILSQEDGAYRCARDVVEWPTDVSPDQLLDRPLVALETSAAPAVPCPCSTRTRASSAGWTQKPSFLSSRA
jgi:hypothetical protein